MARRSRSRDLAGLAALGALGYMAMRGDKQAPAPVEDRSRYVNRAGNAVTSSLATGEPDYSAELAEYRRRVSPAASMPTPEADAATDVRGPHADTGGTGRVNVMADQGAMPPPVSRAQAAAAPAQAAAAPAQAAAQAAAPARAAAPAQVNEAARGRGTNRAAPPPVIGPRSTGQGGAYASEIRAEEERRAIREGRVKKDAQPPVIGPRSTGRGGATAAELAEYQRQQERDRMRGRGYGTTYKKGGAVKAKKMASGGMSSASKRADGIATKGKTKCKMY